MSGGRHDALLRDPLPIDAGSLSSLIRSARPFSRSSQHAYRESPVMNVWRNLHHFIPATSGTASATRPGPSYPIEVDGVFLGAAVQHELGVRFVAADFRVTDMDQSIWPNLDYARRSVRQLFKSARSIQPF